MKLTPEQNEFRDLLHRFFEEKITHEYLRRRIESGAFSDEALQHDIDALGVFQGFSESPPLFSVQELGLLATECGYFLVPEPLVDQLIATGLAPNFLSASDRAAVVALMTGGAEQRGRGSIAYPACCSLVANSQKKTVTGRICWTQGLVGATWCLAFASTQEGSRLIAFSLSSAGITTKHVPSIDLTATLTEVELADTPAVMCDESSSQVIEDLLESIKACEVSGVCKRALEMAVEYAKTRQQFGVPIGAFQAIQQKLADCYAKSEALASVSSFATWSAAHSPEQRHMTARAAILEASRSGPSICEAAIQAHGGIGFTWEYDLHLFLRRAKLVEAAFRISERRAEELLASIA